MSFSLRIGRGAATILNVKSSANNRRVTSASMAKQMLFVASPAVNSTSDNRAPVLLPARKLLADVEQLSASATKSIHMRYNVRSKTHMRPSFACCTVSRSSSASSGGRMPRWPFRAPTPIRRGRRDGRSRGCARPSSPSPTCCRWRGEIDAPVRQSIKLINHAPPPRSPARRSP